MYKKKIHFQMFGMFLLRFIRTAILVVVRPALCVEGGGGAPEESYVSFLICFDGAPVLFSLRERETRRPLPSCFSTRAAVHAVRGGRRHAAGLSAKPSSARVQFTFIPSCTC